jgi:E3 ubiquitin-protein ligase BOI-like protein
MAVDMNYFHPQLLSDRDLIKTNVNPYNNTQMDYALPLCSPMPDQLLPFYHQQPAVCDPKILMMNKSDSGLTYNNNIGSRKRIRDSINDFEAVSRKQSRNGDVLFQFQQQQSDINSLIAQHTEKIKVELEERRKNQLRNLVTTIQEKVAIKMKEKDDEIQRIAKLNWVLQERVKSLYVENQIWRDLAQTNEANANSLRSNLEQVLAHVSSDDNNNSNNHRQVSAAGDDVDDAESSCGSSDHGAKEEITAKAKKEEFFQNGWRSRQPETAVRGGGGGRMCKKCGERESSVLLLPCRHMCMCNMCGSTLVVNCPVCDSVTNASVHVNIS